MDNFVYIVMKRIFIKNEAGLDLTFSAGYSDFISFNDEGDAYEYISKEISDITDVTDIPFVERQSAEIIGGFVEGWKEWIQIGFSKEDGTKIGIVLFKQKIM